MSFLWHFWLKIKSKNIYYFIFHICCAETQPTLSFLYIEEKLNVLSNADIPLFFMIVICLPKEICCHINLSIQEDIKWLSGLFRRKLIHFSDSIKTFSINSKCSIENKQEKWLNYTEQQQKLKLSSLNWNKM